MPKITELTQLNTVNGSDKVHIVDVSDTTHSAEGTSKNITIDDLLAEAIKATGDQTISGNVGIGTAYDLQYAMKVGAGISASVYCDRANGKPTIKASDVEGGHLILDAYDGNSFINHYVSGDVILASGGGNVGVGTSSPSNQLHVHSGNSNIVANFESSDSGAEIILKDNATTGSSAIQRIGNDLRLCRSGGNIIAAGGGNVGIGTTSPTEKMQISSSSDTWVSIKTSNTTSKAGIMLGDSGSDNIGGVWYDNSSDTMVLKANNLESFKIKPNGAVNTPNLPITDVGLSIGDIWNDGGTLKIV